MPATTAAPSRPANLVIDHHHAATRDGWHLELRRTLSPAHLSMRGRPVLIVPGYGMNSFIFGYHPRGTSMERCLAEAGFEVWSANLRGQGDSKAKDRSVPGPSMAAYAEQDLPALIDKVISASRLHPKALDLIGCSLGGSIAYAHLALFPTSPIHALITVGAPLRWSKIHPALATAFRSEWLAGKFVIRGTRKLMQSGIGLLKHVPSALSIYLNAAHVDLAALPEMMKSVEDPHPTVNQDIARWLRHKDLIIAGRNITEALRSPQVSNRPLLIVVSNRDGIVPESANLSITDAWGGDDLTVLRVGDDQNWYAHADLFIGNEAPRDVFAPLAEWLHVKSGMGGS